MLKKDDLGGKQRREKPFVVKWSAGGDAHEEGLVYAEYVLDTSGSYGNPGRVGPGGGAAVGERALEAAGGRWLSYFIPDVLGAERAEYADRHTLVVGAGFSAITTIAALLQVQVNQKHSCTKLNRSGDFAITMHHLTKVALSLLRGAGFNGQSE